MARVKLTEYRAKKLILGTNYTGVSILSPADARTLKKGQTFAVKVDQGVKKRFKQGLVALDVTKANVEKVIAPWKKKGFTRFIAEPMFVHKANEEHYLSLERVRDGIRVMHTTSGGIHIEEHGESIATYLVTNKTVVDIPGVPQAFLTHLISVFEDNFFAFLEINPLIVRGDTVHLLDAAVLVDDAGKYFVKNAWSEADIVESLPCTEVELRVQDLQKTSPASFKLSILNPNGSLFFLLSGGGGSIVIADEASLHGAGNLIANYGEYSGGPTREETYLYTKEVLALLYASRAKKKALVIAGGVANFTDVEVTFAGVIDAFTDELTQLQKVGVKVFVRRGGPNEKKGLAHMEKFLSDTNLLGSIHGSAAPITQAVDDALTFLHV